MTVSLGGRKCKEEKGDKNTYIWLTLHLLTQFSVIVILKHHFFLLQFNGEREHLDSKTFTECGCTKPHAGVFLIHYNLICTMAQYACVCGGEGMVDIISPIIPVREPSVQLLSCGWLFVTPWAAARQASLSITNSQSLLKLISMKSVMLSNHLILCHPFLLLPAIFPSIRVFSDESVLRIRWPKYWRLCRKNWNLNSNLLQSLRS